MKKLKPFVFILSSILLLVYISSCEKIMPQAPADEDLLDGPVEGLSSEQKKLFLRGDIAFNDEIFNDKT